MNFSNTFFFIVVVEALVSCNLLIVPDELSTGVISSINCSEVEISGVFIASQNVQNVKMEIPYDGGDGGTFPSQKIYSNGVLGLTATLDAGNFNNGSGFLLYKISGSPDGTGSANFSINIGGQVCLIEIQILMNSSSGTVESLNCGEAMLNGGLISGIPVGNVTVTVPYTGGDGGAYSSSNIPSSVVSGLSALLTAGNFSNGDGNLVFQILGTPVGSGLALFELNVGGKICSLEVTVASGGISGLFCQNSIYNGYLVVGKVAENVTVEVPYSGGMGNSYSAQTVSSTVVDGLTANLSSGSFLTGSGYLIFLIEGVPASVGTAKFEIIIGGQTCTLSLPVGCGAYTSPDVFKEFMCYNLGSANTNTDPFTPSWEINGGYWQWGRVLEAAPGPIGPEILDTNEDFIFGWNNTYSLDGAWVDNFKTNNDPCPAGFRVPTKAQWEGIINNNEKSCSGTWHQLPTNYSAGCKIGDRLFLPASGRRRNDNGLLSNRGESGTYWSSSINGNEAYYFLTSDGSNFTQYTYRSFGFSVRCIAE